MPLDPKARRFLGLIEAAARGKQDGGVEGLRRATNALIDFAAPPSDVKRDDVQLQSGRQSLAARVYSPPTMAEATLPGLVYFHGGGLVSGSLASHDALCAELTATAACRVISIDYRLAPEHRFPAAHEDAVDAVRAVFARAGELSIDPARIAVGGDSAGANLACFAARYADAPLKLLFLLCPVLDMLAREPSRFELASGYLIEERTMEQYWSLYRVDVLASDDGRVAPLRAGQFLNYPPTRIHTAEFDPLRDEGAALANAITSAGGDARCREHEGQIHHFYGLTSVIPSAKAALSTIAEDLAEGLQT